MLLDTIIGTVVLLAVFAAVYVAIGVATIIAAFIYGLYDRADHGAANIGHAVEWLLDKWIAVVVEAYKVGRGD